MTTSEAARVLGKVRSAKKAAAARANGNKGGRPRKSEPTAAQIDRFADRVVTEWRRL